MKLYYTPGACSLSPHILARELGLPLALIRVDIRAHKTESGEDYYAINPKGSVPLLVLDNGETLSEGPIICQYLAEQAGRVDILPAVGDMARYRVLEWQAYLSTEIHKFFSPLFNPTISAETKAAFAAMLERKFSWIDQQLAGRAFLAGEAFSVVDPYLFTLAGWCGLTGVNIEACAHLQAYLGRLAQRPAFQAALQAEGLLKA